jgi:hypothetical protein
LSFVSALLLDTPTAWDYTRDIATMVLAVASIVVAVLVFTYQKTQDRNAASESARQLNRTTRLEWVRLLIIEPNRDYILDFFQRLEKSLQKVNHDHLSFDQQIEIASELDGLFREFDRRFLSYFDSISLLDGSSPHRQLIEALQEGLTVELDKFVGSDYVLFHRRMVQDVIKCRNQFLAALYALASQEQKSS